MRAGASQSVTLAWTASSDPAAAGFKLYYGPASRTYTNSIIVGNVTNATIGGLLDGTAYYFAATTYDASGNESAYSQEIYYVTPEAAATNGSPVITNTTPVITNTVPVITNTVPVTTNTVTVNTNLAFPTMNPLFNLSLRANTDVHSVVLTGLSAGRNNGRSISVSASSSNPGLIPNPTVQLSSSGTAGTLYFQAAPNALGAVVITVTVNNTNAVNNSFRRSFTVLLTANAAVTSNLRPPTFFRRPANAVAVVGHSISLSTSATGLGLLKYSWQLNGRAIPGATTPTLNLKNISKAQAGVYSVTVTSQFGSTNSLASVIVYDSPAATLGTMTRAANGNFTFPVTGVPGYKYVVQATTDLTHWTSVATNTSPFVFEDKQTDANDKRFFRAAYNGAL